ncbi:two-component sensor histidine kinase [Mycobacterium sp. 852002-51163_SCH5372311]|uniref:HAMP domain-containing sensor histidine kinase n=1 Tax=Mycobacterium sp. 852002-51163_SCH5372311 TaxID=1834097 RepID=UPI0007FF2194|nr:HAMP domain-containing sensor histidine kinase [Mycobacterium sp. 852002-51163_SCH5372311]OBF81174.1 two-component sensor histidine kinase [Mycobacterium sp. 852002-51163_SCH5372311]
MNVFVRLRPRYWGIATRAAAVSAAVVLAALALATAGLLALLYFLLLSGVDDATGARVTDIVTALRVKAPAQLDESLMTTNQRVAAVQVVDGDGHVVRRSSGAPTSALAPAGLFGPTLKSGLPDDVSPGDDMRLAGQTVGTPAGTYTVVVGGASEAVEGIVRTVAILLAAVSPLMIAVATFGSYALVKRSLRSVDAIRSRVAEISVSDLSERVPVPESRDEIAALAGTMNAMLERVEAGHLAQRQFVGDASHELRSPLTTIIYALELVESHPELLDIDMATSTLLPEAHRMKVLVEDLLLLARADEIGLAIPTEEVRLADIVESAAARLRRETTLAIDTDIDGRTRVIGDEAALARMVRNLADNAARHAASRIELSVHEANGVKGQVVFVIADDGPGIPEAERNRVFDRFVRLDTDRSRQSGGSGLGLAIVAEIVRAHHGSITISDRPGGGARITVTIPSGQ